MCILQPFVPLNMFLFDFECVHGCKYLYCLPFPGLTRFVHSCKYFFAVSLFLSFCHFFYIVVNSFAVPSFAILYQRPCLIECVYLYVMTM